jgi:hypothetical protein
MAGQTTTLDTNTSNNTGSPQIPLPARRRSGGKTRRRSRFYDRSDAAHRRELEAALLRRQQLDARCPRTARLRDELSGVLYEGERSAAAQAQLELLYIGLGIAADSAQELTPEEDVALRRQIGELL